MALLYACDCFAGIIRPYFSMLVYTMQLLQRSTEAFELLCQSFTCTPGYLPSSLRGAQRRNHLLSPRVIARSAATKQSPASPANREGIASPAWGQARNDTVTLCHSEQREESLRCFGSRLSMTDQLGGEGSLPRREPFFKPTRSPLTTPNPLRYHGLRADLPVR